MALSHGESHGTEDRVGFIFMLFKRRSMECPTCHECRRGMFHDGDAAPVVPQPHDLLRPDGLQVAEDGRQRRVGGGGHRRHGEATAATIRLSQVQRGWMRRGKIVTHFQWSVDPIRLNHFGMFRLSDPNGPKASRKLRYAPCRAGASSKGGNGGSGRPRRAPFEVKVSIPGKGARWSAA